jgi:hypothetical protein
VTRAGGVDARVDRRYGAPRTRVIRPLQSEQRHRAVIDTLERLRERRDLEEEGPVRGELDAHSGRTSASSGGADPRVAEHIERNA